MNRIISIVENHDGSWFVNFADPERTGTTSVDQLPMLEDALEWILTKTIDPEAVRAALADRQAVESDALRPVEELRETAKAAHPRQSRRRKGK